MYKFKSNQLAFSDFNQPAGLDMDSENRWVKLADRIPWDVIEEKYAELFPSKVGYPAKPLRLVLGALLIQQMCGFSDRDLVQMIRENPYMQYFCGYSGYDARKDPFNPSALVGFRKRLSLDILGEVNDMIIALDKEDSRPVSNDDDDSGSSAEPPTGTGAAPGDDAGADAGCTGARADNSSAVVPEATTDASDDAVPEATQDVQPEQPNEGTIILDATCAPSNIRYPQDTSLLNEAREKAEGIIDRLHAQVGGKKPRTYRIKAAKRYKRFVLKRKHTRKEVRREIRAQLGFVGRDLKAIQKLQDAGAQLSAKDAQLLHTLSTVHEQQKFMYDNKTHRVPDRIVSIEQPYIRPIVRGKVKDPVEFGAKVHMSLSDGYARFDYVSWDAFNEGTLLKDSVEAYRKREGHYPQRVLADKIYRNRENLRYCKEHGIRLMGPPLGRPKKDPTLDRELLHKDGIDRIEIERQFSLDKRCCGLGKIWTRRQQTSECSLGLSLIALNLKKITRKAADFLCALFTARAFRRLRYNFFSMSFAVPNSSLFGSVNC